MKGKDNSKPVNATQGKESAPCHPKAIHDFYPPMGTKEHADFHNVAPLPTRNPRES